MNRRMDSVSARVIDPQTIASIATRLLHAAGESAMSADGDQRVFEPLPSPRPNEVFSHVPYGPLSGIGTTVSESASAFVESSVGESGVSLGASPHKIGTSAGATERFSGADSAIRSSPDDGLRRFIEQIRSLHTSEGTNAFLDEGRLAELRQRVRAIYPEPQSALPLDVAAIRAGFPILAEKVHGKPLVWLDNAATTQKPRVVLDAIYDFYARDNSNIHRAAHALAARATDGFEESRRIAQRFLNASHPEEIVFVRGTTEGINLIAHTLGKAGLRANDEILLSHLEHHANIVPWQLVAEQTGAVLRVIPVNDRGEILMAEYARMLGPRTRVVALTHASNSLGTILPVEEMTHLARQRGAYVVLDGAQSVPHFAVDVTRIGCDAYVFSGHKIFGPTGIGVVYARRELLESLPPWQGGGNMIRDVTFEHTTFQDAPARFEAGTPNIADAIGLGVALDYVSRLGLPRIEAYEQQLLTYATDGLLGISGLTLHGTAAQKVGVLSFTLRGHSPEDVGKYLDRQGIAVRAGHHCSQPSLRRMGVEATVRPSLSIYNTREEVDYLVDSLRHLQHR